LPLTPPVETLAEVNAGIDIMNWPQRKFLGSDATTKLLVEQLRLRRCGQMSASDPIGLLTHHLVMDDEAWRFAAELLRFLNTHSAAELVPADRLFDQQNANALAPLRCANTRGAEVTRPVEVTVVVTSCGRQDLLEITLDSFLQYNTLPITEFIVVEDGDGAKNQRLTEKYSEHP